MVDNRIPVACSGEQEHYFLVLRQIHGLKSVYTSSYTEWVVEWFLVRSSFYSDAFYKWRWLFGHSTFVIGMVVLLSAVLFSAFISHLVLNCLEAVHLPLLSQWILDLHCVDMHCVRIFPLIVAEMKNWKHVGLCSETLVCLSRPLERIKPCPSPYTSILGTSQRIWELFELLNFSDLQRCQLHPK